MIIGPKYKIARRLGVPVFEKTQTQKFALSQARKDKNKKRGFRKPKSDYGIQLLEKQKARYTYCLTEKQFAKYVKIASAKKDKQAGDHLFEELELRADNTAYRSGFAPTRLASRQLVSHGHIFVNGKKITIPSYKLSVGDIMSIRPNSQKKNVFLSLEDRLKELAHPSWLKFNHEKREVVIQGTPKYDRGDSLFDINSILEFYSR